MKVFVKYSFIFILFFCSFIIVSAQSILWKTYSDSGKQAYGRGNYVEAEKLFKAALKEAENLKDLELIARSNDFLGGLYFQQDKYDEAEKFFLKSIESWEKQGLNDGDEITYPLSNLGLTYAEQKKFDKAEEVLRRAISIREKTKNPDIAGSLLNLGKVYADQKKSTEAQVVYEKALTLFIVADDINIEGTLNTASNLSLIYEETKNYKKLEAIYRILIDLIGKNYSLTNSNLLPYLDKYAVLLRKLNRNSEAAKVEFRAKKIRSLIQK